MSFELTKNYNLKKTDFDSVGWHDDEHDNDDLLDGILSASAGIISVTGLWDIGVAYIVGNKLIDADESTLWECLVAHTSAASGLFLTDRTANPTYWKQVNGAPSNKATWITATSYQVTDIINDATGFLFYISKETHTSGATLAADVALGKWELIMDLTSAFSNFTAFNNAYLGVQASDPTLDNDGNAVSGGEFYFNSVSSVMRVYDGISAWFNFSAPSAGAVTNVAAGGIAATDVQAALNELDVEMARLSSAEIFTALQTFQNDIDVISPSGGTIVQIGAADGSTANLIFSDEAGLDRWVIQKNSVAESGSNVGSDFGLFRYDDAGSLIGSVLTVARSTGVLNFSIAPTIGGVAISIGTHTHGPSGLDTDAVETAKILNNNVTYAKIQNVAADNVLLGNVTGASSAIQELTGASVRALLGIEAGATADQSNAEIKTAYEAAVDIVTALQAVDPANVTSYRWTPERVHTAIASAAAYEQVIHKEKSDTFTSAATADTWLDVTDMSQAITLLSTTNKVEGRFSLNVSGNSANQQIFFRIMRDAVAVAVGDAASNRTQVSAACLNVGIAAMTHVTIPFLDEPGGLGPFTYKIQVRQIAANIIYVNRSDTDTNNEDFARAASSLILREVSV